MMCCAVRWQGKHAFWPACGAWHSAVVVWGDDSDSGGGGGGDEASEAAGAAGRVYVWGDNSKGQLGVPDVARAMEPMVVGGELAKAQVKQVRGNLRLTPRDNRSKSHWAIQRTIPQHKVSPSSQSMGREIC
jgi:hypothetical protein